MKHKSKLVTLEMIIDEVFENESIETNTPRNLVYKTRKLLGNDKVIVSVKDYGYISELNYYLNHHLYLTWSSFSPLNPNSLSLSVATFSIIW